MAVFLFLVAILCGVLVGDLVVENPGAGEVVVFNQPVNGYSQGWLLAMAAALGVVVALFLVASVNSTSRRRARRKQLRTISSGRHREVAEPQRHQASLLDEWFGRQQSVGALGEPARPSDLGGGRRADRATDRHITLMAKPTEHHPGSFHERTRRGGPPAWVPTRTSAARPTTSAHGSGHRGPPSGGDCGDLERHAGNSDEPRELPAATRGWGQGRRAGPRARPRL